MQARDKVGKLTLGLLDSSKDSVEANLVAALRGGQLKVEATQVPTLLMIVKASIDEGFHKGYRSYLKSIDVVVADAIADSKDIPEKASKKK